MLYLGHFSWDAEESPRFPFGWFTTLCEAESAEDATDKFEEFIIGAKEWFDGFEDVCNVILESIIEVRELPPEGVLGHFTQITPPRDVLTVNLPGGVPGDGCVVYTWGRPTGDDGLPLDGEMIEPFVSFTEDEEEEEEVRP